MGDERNDLPEGTDTIIDTEDTAALPSGEGTSDDTGATVIAETTIVTEKEIPAPSGNAERPVTGSGSAESGLAQRFRDGSHRRLRSRAAVEVGAFQPRRGRRRLSPNRWRQAC